MISGNFEEGGIIVPPNKGYFKITEGDFYDAHFKISLKPVRALFGKHCNLQFALLDTVSTIVQVKLIHVT